MWGKCASYRNVLGTNVDLDKPLEKDQIKSSKVIDDAFLKGISNVFN